MISIFAKILSVFSISLIGYIANRKNWLPAESTKYLSLLLINIASPCLVVYSMSRQELNTETLVSVAQTVGLMLLALAAVTGIGFIIVRLMDYPAADRGVYHTLMILTNCGFMGFPLVLAVFGEKGLFLMIIANAVFILYTYTVGVLMLNFGKDEKLTLKKAIRSVLSIPVVSTLAGLLIFAFGIPLPAILSDLLNTVGGITIPLSMIIIGMQLAESKLREVLNNRHIYITLMMRLVIIPAVLFGLFVWLPVSPFVLCIVIFAMSMPSAAIVPVLAEIHGSNAKLAAQIVFVTTLFSLATIPVSAILLNLYLLAN